MPKDDRGLFLQRSLEQFQKTVVHAGPAAAASYTLVGAIILFGGIGYAVDGWLGTAPWLLVTALVLGIIVGFLNLARTVWQK